MNVPMSKDNITGLLGLVEKDNVLGKTVVLFEIAEVGHPAGHDQIETIVPVQVAQGHFGNQVRLRQNGQSPYSSSPEASSFSLDFTSGKGGRSGMQKAS